MYGNYNEYWSNQHYTQEYHTSPQYGLQPSIPPLTIPYPQDCPLIPPVGQVQEPSPSTSNSRWDYMNAGINNTANNAYSKKNVEPQYQPNSYQSSNSGAGRYSSSSNNLRSERSLCQERQLSRTDQKSYAEATDSSNDTSDPNNPEYVSPLKALEAKRAVEPPSNQFRSEVFHRPRRPKPDLPDNKRPPPVDIDGSIPSEIAALFKTNSCDLCDVKLNSRIQSKTHYEGKPHAKKLKTTVDEYREKHSVPTSAIDTIYEDNTNPPPAKKKKKSLTDGSQLYCKCCDLSFTSMDHATQHYLGRNHQRVLHGLKPLKAGYYNKDNGKWQRMPSDPITPTERLIDSDHSDGDSVKEKGRFFCELCCVAATSQDQLDGHLKGQKHKKTQQIASKKQNQSGSNSADSILASVIKGEEAKKVKSKDFSIYRTPSGKFYCSPCDTTLNSESQFGQHVESKKHKMKKK